MDRTLLTILSLLAGGLIGGVGVWFVLFSKRLSRSRAAARRPQLSDIATTIFDNFESAAVILDASLTPIYANHIARDDHRFIGSEMFRDPGFLRSMREVMQTGAPFNLVPDTADFAGANLRVRAFRLQQRFVAVLIDDIGEAQRVNAMRRDFIANVSHELKTPVAAIGLLAEAMLEGADEPETVKQFAGSLVHESKRLGELSRDIIHLSQAQSALRPEDREPINLRKLIKSEVKAHQNLAEQQQVDLVITESLATAKQEATMLGRKSALGTAVANVLSNAIRYSPPGGRVGVGLRINTGKLEVSVTDQGPGIPPEYQQRVFERFFRIDSSRTRDSGGTGLGLSIARHTMRAHGGEIELWSKEGVGSTFTLFFPLHENLRLPADAQPKKPRRKKLDVQG